MITETKNTKAFYNAEIPIDWEMIEFGEFAEVSKGKYNPIENKNLKCLELEHLEQVKGAINGWTNSVEQKSIKNKFKNGQVLFGKLRPYLQKYWLADFDGVCSSEIWVLDSISKKCTNEFLFRIVQTNKFIQVANVSSGSKMPRADWEFVASFPFLLPPIPEQKAIAQVLSTADAAIYTTEKLIVQKELRKKWLMQQLLTGKKRLKGFEGEWKKERLEKYLVKHDEKSTENNQYPVLTSSRRGIFLQSDYYTRDVASEDNTGYNVVPRGYFTYRHMSDDLIFKFNINDIVDRGIVSTLYPVFTTKDINSYFLLVKLNEGSEFKMHAEEQKQGGSRTYVYFKTLCQLKLNLPTIEEQTAIAQVLQAADKEISLLKAKAGKLREQKKGLMQVLLTGKVRLKIN